MDLQSLYLRVIVGALLFTSVLCQECQLQNRLHNNPGVNSVMVTFMDHSDLFNFDNDERYYCGPTNIGHFTMTISYSSPVLLREIGIHGRDQTFALTSYDDYVTRFSLSFSEDGYNFTDYIPNAGSPVFSVSNARQHRFALQPPITASSIKISINAWNDRPCISLLMLGCNYSDASNDVHSTLVGDSTLMPTTMQSVMTMSTVAVIPSATEFFTQLITKSFTQTTMEGCTEITTERLTVYHTVTVDVTHTPTPSPSQISSAAASTSCSSDTDNTPIYVAVVIVIVGLLITIIVVIVGVLLCYRNQKIKESDRSSSPLKVKYTPTNNTYNTGVSVVEVDNDLYGKEGLQRQSQSSSEDNEHAQMELYDSVNQEPDVTESVDNPQYGDTLKQSEDTTANPKSNENVYTYAIP